MQFDWLARRVRSKAASPFVALFVLPHAGCGWVGVELLPPSAGEADVERDAASETSEHDGGTAGELDAQTTAPAMPDATSGDDAAGDAAESSDSAAAGEASAHAVEAAVGMCELLAASDAACDGALAGCDAANDACDAHVTEALSECDVNPRRFEAGAHLDIAIPRGCGHVSVRLWGAGGAGGADIGVLGAGGEGGPGGYAMYETPISGSLSLWIGQGGAEECRAEGTNAGASIYNGGAGGPDVGAAGSDGIVSGGGAGAQPDPGRAGGRGHFGGGGGGQGSGGLGLSGEGGGGGAASVFLMNGVRLAVAGGGGGGGGAQSITPLGTLAATGGDGGSGCGGAGGVDADNGGGGGGGGVCLGASIQAGTERRPAWSEDIPGGRAQGGSGGCGAGGAGYAILRFSR